MIMMSYVAQILIVFIKTREKAGWAYDLLIYMYNTDILVDSMVVPCIVGVLYSMYY